MLVSCDSTGSNQDELLNFTFTDKYILNFDADSASITMEQSLSDRGYLQGGEPEIEIADSTLSAGQVVLQFSVQTIDITTQNPDANEVFELSEDSLYFWYSFEDRSRTYRDKIPKKNSSKKTIISAGPTVPALTIKKIQIKKNEQMILNVNYFRD